MLRPRLTPTSVASDAKLHTAPVDSTLPHPLGSSCACPLHSSRAHPRASLQRPPPVFANLVDLTRSLFLSLHTLPSISLRSLGHHLERDLIP